MGCFGRRREQPNPISGLTKRDVKTIQRTWAPIYRNSDVYGMELFTRFFRADPETKKLFKRIQTMEEADYKNFPQFRMHVYSFMTGFNMMIKKLDQPEVVVPMVERLGESHKRSGVPEKHFMTLKTVFVSFLQNDLQLKSEEIESWARFLGFIYPIIIAALKKP